MFKKIISKLFGDGGSASPVASVAAHRVSNGEPDLEGLVSYIVTSLVEAPGEVKVAMCDKDDATLINITCRKSDIGRIVGKNGKTIDAIRSLVKGAALRVDKRARVEILEQ